MADRCFVGESEGSSKNIKVFEFEAQCQDQTKLHIFKIYFTSKLCFRVL
jgi:hypothetical protein